MDIMAKCDDTYCSLVMKVELLAGHALESNLDGFHDNSHNARTY